MSETNKAILFRWYEEGVNNRNIGLLEEMFHPDFVFRSLSFGGGRGYEEARGYIGAILAAFPDWRIKVEDLIAEGDQVVAVWSAGGHHQGDFLGIAPTGREIVAKCISTIRIADGRIAETCDALDAHGLIAQLKPAPGSTEANKALARRYLEEFLNNGEWDSAREIFAEDYVFRAPNLPELRGRDGMAQYGMAMKGSFPDVRFKVLEMIAEDDRVAVRWEGSGTHTGEWMGAAPTGKFIRWTGIDILRIADGRIAEEWGEIDVYGCSLQVGAPLSLAPAAP